MCKGNDSPVGIVKTTYRSNPLELLWFFVLFEDSDVG